MNELWRCVVVTRIAIAVYVAPGTGRSTHSDRPWHGLVLNEPGTVRDYCFADGQVLHTGGGELFYLPRGSSYSVKTIRSGGCYAINFEAEIAEEPFSVTVRNYEQILHQFRAAANGWKTGDPLWQTAAMRAVYDAVYQLLSRQTRQYMPESSVARIRPALERMNRDFTADELTVSYLAGLCGISEVYFRKLFLNLMGVSPKEYLIQKRIDYAKSLLMSGDFSVSETAVLCGYGEPCHFSRVFSCRVGVSPNRYLQGRK